MHKYSKHHSRACLDSTLINKQVDYYTHKHHLRACLDSTLKTVKPKKRKFLMKSSQGKSDQSNHGHAYLPPFGIIEKG